MTSPTPTVAATEIRRACTSPTPKMAKTAASMAVNGNSRMWSAHSSTSRRPSWDEVPGRYTR